ncbi:dolichol-phosphate mannosyltransferase subunit 3 [Blastocystis sp. ATCC 50177/Nand II]|uniref:Dolichol-phosphate mannosyltransferase subunit 3 n=1 Tax=Blastocystis sp. subtype 1 (strain ATCC 50177 / NandII) TaxID=478820 RepID=A0A196SEQ2_BLAHN|nr:dolichol-phosphate mannosyltransferase subunit 3 [Blastocystis sp. ATCC 50177/Nand II]
MDRTKEIVDFNIPRYKMFFLVFGFYAIMYLYLVFGPVGKMFDRNVFLLIQWSPVIGVVGFGIYALYTIVKNVINLKNYPDEAESLLKDVQEAKEGLRKRGYKGDL